MTSIEQNYHLIRQDLVAACCRAGRNPEDVRIVAVSKTVGPAEIAQAISAGIEDFAENRTVLFRQRSKAFPQQRWHFIGVIQTNKVKDFAGHATLVHSVASERALRAIDARMALLAQDAALLAPDACMARSLREAPMTLRAQEEHMALRAQSEHPALNIKDAVADVFRQPVLIEVNVSGETSKDGIASARLEDLLQIATTMEHISIKGLMTMAPLGNPSEARATFSGLRELRDTLAVRFQDTENVCLSELSMGMTDDYTIAIEEGSTIIRIGRALWS